MTDIKQVGGDHYTAPSGLQHWDLIEKHDIAYLEAQASRYILRYDRKGKSLEDLEKALSFLLKMQQARATVRRTVPSEDFTAFCLANRCDGLKTRLLMSILMLGTEWEIGRAVASLHGMIADERRKNA